MSPRIVILGGGVIGSAIAYFVCRDPAFRGEVTVIERDPTYREASSALSVNSIRQQFSTAVNIEISRFAIGFLREAHARLAVDGKSPTLDLVEPGYLFLATHAGVDVLERNHALQRTLGADIALLETPSLRARFPWLSVHDIAAGALGLSGEGWLDGYGLLQAFRSKALSLGARYINAEAICFSTSGRRVTSVALADGSEIGCDIAVNAAGPWAAAVARWIGVDLPVRARKRSVFVFTCPTPLEPRDAVPLVVDPSGVWFRPEGHDRFLGGVSPDAGEDPDDLPLEPDLELFEEIVWPTLAARVPAFEALRRTRAWAGYYDFNTLDQNAILGLHPEWENVFFANGFSGHGMQQSPAVGRGIAELVLHGGYRTLDLTPLGFDRVIADRPFVEMNVI